MLTINNCCINEKNISYQVGLSLLAGGVITIIEDDFKVREKMIDQLSRKNNFSFLDEEITENEFMSQISKHINDKHLNMSKSLEKNLCNIADKCSNQILLPAIIQYFSFYNILSKKIKKLSPDDQQMASLSSLMLDPKRFWLLDRPLKNLTEEKIQLVINLIAGKSSDNGFVIIFQHSEDLLITRERILLEEFRIN